MHYTLLPAAPHADITIFEKNQKVLAKVEIMGGVVIGDVNKQTFGESGTFQAKTFGESGTF